MYKIYDLKKKKFVPDNMSFDTKEEADKYLKQLKDFVKTKISKGQAQNEASTDDLIVQKITKD